MSSDTGKGKGGGKGPKKGKEPASQMKCVLKFLTPEPLASAIIGKEGKVIAAMRTSCQAKLGLSEHSDFYPSTDCRVLTAQTNEAESLTELGRQIIAKVAELAKAASENEEELTLKVLIPKAAGGGIIGKGGASIKELRESSGAKISIGSDAIGFGPGAEQVVTLNGSAQALELALKEINTQVQGLNGESWFQQWASTSHTTNSASAHTYQVPYAASYNSPGVDMMMSVARQLPRYVMEDSRGFALSCVVPERLVGGLIGRGGSGTKEIQQRTGTKINIREISGDTENRSLNIAGPLPNTCAAYMMMMQRYLDAEASAS
jgi:transcription antitermination factor NusA-like protein